MRQGKKKKMHSASAAVAIVSKEKCLFQNAAVLLLAVSEIVLHPRRQRALECMFPPQPVTKTKQSKNNKSFILFKVNPELLCWITVTMHEADGTLLFPYRANVWTKNLLTVFKDQFQQPKHNYGTPPFCLLKLQTQLNRERHFYHFTGCYLKKCYRPVWGLECKGSMQELDKRNKQKRPLVNLMDDYKCR